MSALLFALRLTCCSCWLICLIVVLVRPIRVLANQQSESSTPNILPTPLGDAESSSSLANVDLDVYDDEEDIEEDLLEINVTAEAGKYLGSPCITTCNPLLQHVFCDSVTGHCECEKAYPVRLAPGTGCAKAKKLGEQCLYRATCTFSDQHSICKQVRHNAVCECEDGYHRVAHSRPSRKVFCAKDLVLISTDIPTLLYVISGIAIFTGLICFVLKLFSSGRYTRPRHFANAGHPAPMLFTSDTGIPLTIHGGRPASRSSHRSSDGNLACTFNRKSSAGPLVPASRAGAARAAAILLISCHRQATNGNGNTVGMHRRALSDVAEGSSDGLGSRRPSLASIHSTSSSAKSYSARRLDRERSEKEQRHALQELKLAKQREQQQQQQHMPTPSPRTPHSTDELLPCVEEGIELFYNEIPTTSGTMGTAITKTRTTIATTPSGIAAPLIGSEGDTSPLDILQT